MPPRLPLGQQVHAALIARDRQTARALAQNAGQPDLFARVDAVASAEPIPNFLHSALCAMSLPVRRPADERAPIIRQDGHYTLVITPKPIVERIDGQQRLSILGVPYGSLPRLVLIHIMTEAVRTKSRHIVLGTSFTDWMRRMGFRTVSYGPRGSATLVREQLDRLLACEWMIRWDSDADQGEKEFAIKEIKLSTEYAGVDRGNGSFAREIYLTEGFHDHLRAHAVPLNENAIWQIRDSATALDLYTWLAYRLPRVSSRRPVTMSWQQLATHFGNAGTNIRKFRQTVRDVWERHVSGVYPEARAEFDTTVVRLYASPAPLSQRLVGGTRLALATDDQGTPAVAAPAPPASPEAYLAGLPGRFLAILRADLDPIEARVWLADAQLERSGDSWILVTTTAFKAHWLRTRLSQALERAARAVQLPGRPEVQVRTQRP